MRGHRVGGPTVSVLAILAILMLPSFIPLQTGSDHDGLASAAKVETFLKDKKSLDQVDLHLRPPMYKNSAGIPVPFDGMAIKGNFDLEAKEWTREGKIEQNTTEDFMTASTLEHVKVDNGSVRLEDVPAELSISASNAWGHGKTSDLSVGDTLSLGPASGMAFQWDNVLSNASNEQENVVLKVDQEGVTHCVYEDNSKGLDVYYARSVDGSHYTDYKYLDSTNSRFIPQQSPDMVIDDLGRIHVVYADGRTTPNDLDIMYTMSQDHGDHFSAETRVDHGGTEVQNDPSIAVDGQGNIYVAWEDGREGNTTVYFNKNFGPDTRVSVVHRGYQVQPELSVDTNGNVHILWRDNRSAKNEWRLYHALLPPGSTTFQGEALLYWIYYGFAQYFPTLEPGDNGRMYTAWADNRTFEFNIYLSYSDDGLTFAEPMRLSPILVKAYQPSLSYRDGTLHIAWYDYRDEGNTHIYYTNTTDGKAFAAAYRVDHTNGTSRPRSPAIAAGTDGWPRVAWVDFRQHQNGDLFTTRGTVNHMKNGTLELVADLGSRPYRFTGAEALGDLPVGTGVDIIGQTSPDNITWSAPVHLMNASGSLTPDRYLRIRAEITTNNTGVTPYISKLAVHYSKFVLGGTVVSMGFKTTYEISKVMSRWGGPYGDDGITFSVSVDGGLSWTQLVNGAERNLANPGSPLSYKLDLSRMAFGTPSVEWLSITYTEHSYPKDLTVTVGDSKVWHFSGEFEDTVVMPDLADAINEYLKSLGPGSRPDEGNVTVPVEVTGTQVGDLVMKGLSVDIALPPRMTDSGPGSSPETEEGQEVIFWASVTERDGRPLTFTWTVNGEVIENETKYTMTYKVPYSPTAPRTDQISLEVSNGYLRVTKEWNLRVLPSNRPPVIDSQMPELGSVITDARTKALDFQVNASDPDNDTLSYSWTFDGMQQGFDDKAYTLDPSKRSTGDHVVGVEVSDGKATVSREWNVIVMPVGKPTNGDGWKVIAIYAIIALIVILLCGIVFMESYRRARGGRRAIRKQAMVEEDRWEERPKALPAKGMVKSGPKKVQKGRPRA